MSNHIKNIYIDSVDNFESNGLHNDVSITLDEVVSADQYRLVHFEISNVMYNVNASNNAVNLDGSPVTIQEGNYIMSELLTRIQTDLNASSGDTFVASYSDITGLVTIADSTGNYALDFDVDNSFADVIGFDRNATYSGTNTYTGSFPPDLENPIFIEIDSVSSNYVTANSQKMSFYIPNTEARGNTIYYNENEEFAQSCQGYGARYKQMRIKIKNKYNLLHTNVGPWRMILRIED